MPISFRLASIVAAGGLALAGLVVGRREAQAPPIVVRYALPPGPGGCAERALRLVVAGDFHVSRAITPPATVEETVRRINALAPDYVLLVGDYLGDDWPRDRPGIVRALAPLAALRPREGTVAVLGNNDWQDAPEVIAGALQRLGVHVLRNDAWVAPDAAFLGVEEIISNTANPKLATERLSAAIARSPGRRPPPIRFWLAHQPAMFDRMPDTGALLVVGHTHGGQILPALTVPLSHAWMWVSRLRGIANGWPAQQYVRGLYAEGDKRMLVTSGIGVSGPPLRLGVPPEIDLIDVEPCAGPAPGHAPSAMRPAAAGP